MLTRKKIALTILAAAAGAIFILSQSAWSDPKGNSVKLEGTWVAKLPGTPCQWNYVITPTESSGRSASLWGTFTIPIPGALVGLPAQYQTDDLSVFSGEIILTGRNEARGTATWWGLQKTVPGDPGYPFKQVVYIGVGSFTVSFPAPGKSLVTHQMKFYAPTADADGDGLPDPGQQPVFVAPEITSTDTCTSLTTSGSHR